MLCAHQGRLTYAVCISCEQELSGREKGYAAYAFSQVVATSAPQLRGEIFEEGRQQGVSLQQLCHRSQSSDAGHAQPV